MKAPVFSGQIRGPRGQTRSAVDVHRFREILMLRALDHDLLADIAKRVGNRARRYIATEHVAHVLPGRSVSCDISKVPKKYICTRLTIGRFVGSKTRCFDSFNSSLDHNSRCLTFRC